MEAMTSEREAFEKWARGEGYALAKQDDNSYHGIGIRNAWEGWQARAHLAQPAQAVDVGAVLLELRAAADQDGATMGQCFQWWRSLTRALSVQKAGPVGDGWRELCLGLIRVVEGYPPQTWRNGAGERLKDTPEWCAFYVAATELPTSPTPGKEGQP